VTAKTAFDNIIGRAEQLVKLHSDLAAGLQLTSQFSASERESLVCDVLRSALVLAVSAIDRYVHDRVTKEILQAYRTDDLTSAQENFKIPVSAALRIAEKAATAKKTNKQVRAANVVRHEIQEDLHKRPFQSWRDIEYAYSLLGVTGFDGKVQSALQLPNLKPLKSTFASIQRTRNLISHEGHLKRHKRGGKVVLMELDSATVSVAISTLKDVVRALETL
jgi:hypothetical protein